MFFLKPFFLTKTYNYYLIEFGLIFQLKRKIFGLCNNHHNIIIILLKLSYFNKKIYYFKTFVKVIRRKTQIIFLR